MIFNPIVGGGGGNKTYTITVGDSSYGVSKNSAEAGELISYYYRSMSVNVNQITVESTSGIHIQPTAGEGSPMEDHLWYFYMPAANVSLP